MATASQELLFADPPPPSDALFFAIFPEATVASRLSAQAHQLKKKHVLRGAPFLPERFHITLLELGVHRGIPPSLQQTATEAAASINLPAFDLTFTQAMSFAGGTGHRPFVLRTDGHETPLRRLHSDLRTALMKLGLNSKAAFTPHITLLYDAKLVPQESIEPLRFRVSHFALVHSLQGQTRHVKLAQWPLRS